MGYRVNKVNRSGRSGGSRSRTVQEKMDSGREVFRVRSGTKTGKFPRKDEKRMATNGYDLDLGSRSLTCAAGKHEDCPLILVNGIECRCVCHYSVVGAFIKKKPPEEKDWIAINSKDLARQQPVEITSDDEYHGYGVFW